MKILLISIGSRGDMEPFLAAGELLKKYGHEVVCLFPEQFRSLAEESDFRFLSLGTEFIQMLESEVGKVALGGSGSILKKVVSYSQLARDFKFVSKKLVAIQQEVVEQEKPDRIGYHAKAIYPLIWSLNHPGKAILLSPVPYVVHTTKEHSHVVFNRNLGPVLNKATYALARFGLVKTVVKASRNIKITPVIKASQVVKVLEENTAIYTISPSVFPRPAYWPPHYKVLGYHERDKTVAWKPIPALLDFLGRHPKFLMVTFGSMTNPEPTKKTATILNCLEAHGIPAIINTAGGGLEEPEHYDREMYIFVAGIPYDWVLPKTYGIVHHGGSGTTHMALKNGCVSMIIPHIIDQYLWNTIGYKKGVGPRGPSITSLSDSTFKNKVLDLWENPAYKSAAGKIADQMRQEDYEDELVKVITS
jgi:UDP:flavonoid glycosyltransferase YjiC (YdhE family)